MTLAKTSLHDAIQTISGDLIEDLQDVCIFHTKLLIEKCDYNIKILGGKKQLVAALLRFADELDIAASRVPPPAVIDDFAIDPGNLIHWHLHGHIRVEIKEGVVRIDVIIRPSDEKEFKKIIKDQVIVSFENKNKKVMDILKNNKFNITFDGSSDVKSTTGSGKLSEILKAELRRLLLTAPSDPSLYLGGLFRVPELPIPHMERSDDIIALKYTILAKDKEIILAINGVPYAGKSVLAAALARDKDVRRAFLDGVIWLQLGQKPKLTELQAQLAKALGDGPQSFKNVEDGQAYLDSRLAEKDCLIILDDVREETHANIFISSEMRCQFLITTREATLINAIGAQLYELAPLTVHQGRILLAQSANQSAIALPPIADWLAREYANSPATLTMIGGMVRDRSISWSELEMIEQDYRLSLAVFPVNADIPDDVIRMYWSSRNLDNNIINNTIDKLVKLSLIQIIDKHHIRLQGSLHSHIEQHNNPYNLNPQLLETYAKIHPEGSISESGEIYFFLNSQLLETYAKIHLEGGISDSGEMYFLKYLAYHLKSAKKYIELRKLLLNFNWLQRKLDMTHIGAIIADYNLIPLDPELQIVQAALRLAAHILKYDKKQLASQMIGRLITQTHPSIQELLRQATKQQKSSWLRPLRSTLTTPGGALRLTLEGHKGAINTVAMMPNGRSVISGSDDGTLRVWDWASEMSERTLKDHRGWVQIVIVTPDGQQVVSGSADGTVKVWDLATDMIEYTLGRHYDDVEAIDVTPTERQDGVQAIDVTPTERQDGVQAVAMTPDGRRIVSGTTDGTLIIWDVVSRTAEYILKEHIAGVEAVIITHDGQKLISASKDFTIKVWDLTHGKLEKS